MLFSLFMETHDHSLMLLFNRSRDYTETSELMLYLVAVRRLCWT